MSTSKMIAGAAMAGLLCGAYASTASAKAVTDAGGAIVKLADKGQHQCKGHNNCKGQGGCKTGDAGCKGKNTCKGKGGCNTMPKK
jgi:hypothetical protein